MSFELIGENLTLTLQDPIVQWDREAAVIKVVEQNGSRVLPLPYFEVKLPEVVGLRFVAAWQEFHTNLLEVIQMHDGRTLPGTLRDRSVFVIC